MDEDIFGMMNSAFGKKKNGKKAPIKVANVQEKEIEKPETSPEEPILNDSSDGEMASEDEAVGDQIASLKQNGNKGDADESTANRSEDESSDNSKADDLGFVDKENNGSPAPVQKRPVASKRPRTSYDEPQSPKSLKRPTKAPRRATKAPRKTPRTGGKSIVRSRKAPVRKRAVKSKTLAQRGEGVIKRHRWRPGTVALREIRKYQKGGELLLRKLPFIRLVREVAQDICPDVNLRFQGKAYVALQQAAEIYLTELFQDAYLGSVSCGRITLQPKDLKLAMKLKRERVAFSSSKGNKKPHL